MQEEVNVMDEYVRVVFSRLPKLDDVADRGVVTGGIQGMFLKGWSIDDAVAFHNWMQEFNPTVDEDTALRAMSVIAARYPR